MITVRSSESEGGSQPQALSQSLSQSSCPPAKTGGSAGLAKSPVRVRSVLVGAPYSSPTRNATARRVMRNELGGKSKSSSTGCESVDRAMRLQGEGDSCVTAADDYLKQHGPGSALEARLRAKAAKRFAEVMVLLDSGTGTE